MDRWVTDDDMWVRRTAILSQLRHKQHTDAERLFAYCLARAHEREFFIRKAIGWALREYSKASPEAGGRIKQRPPPPQKPPKGPPRWRAQGVRRTGRGNLFFEIILINHRYCGFKTRYLRIFIIVNVPD